MFYLCLLSAPLRSNGAVLFYLCLLSAPLRSNGADYVLPLFIYLFIIGSLAAADYVLLRFIFLFYFLFFFYSPFVLRNYPTDSHKIFRNCVF